MSSLPGGHIDPYGLLGVTPASSIDDARRSYYQLALMVHPDRGGTAADMAVLREAYEYVRSQLTDADATRTRTQMQTAETGAETGDSRSEAPAVPTWQEVLDEALFDSCAFNVRFEQRADQPLLPAASARGYGDLMDPSEYAAQPDPAQAGAYAPPPGGEVPGPAHPFGPGPVVLYEAPDALRQGAGGAWKCAYAFGDPSSACDVEVDFSAPEDKPLPIVDYRAAFMDPPPHDGLEAQPPRPATLEDMIAQRQNQTPWSLQ